MKSVFSTIVVVSIVFYVIWYFMPLASEYIYDYETQGGLLWANFGSKININGPVPYIFAILYLVASFGLLFYQSWSRTLFLVLTIISVTTAPLWGLSVQGGYDAMVGYIVTLCDGAILALAYFSSVGGEFKRNT